VQLINECGVTTWKPGKVFMKNIDVATRIFIGGPGSIDSGFPGQKFRGFLGPEGDRAEKWVEVVIANHEQ